MNRAADNIRILAAAAVEKAKSGHPGGAMGGADFINVLYSEFLEYDPDNAGWEGRDRFFLDPGHMAPMLYGQLCLAGKFTLEDLQNLRQWGSVTPGHPEREIERMIENTSGPLGQGHTFAVGAAIAAKWFNTRYGASITLLFMPSSPMVVYRKRSRKAQVVSQDTSGSITSLCSMTPTPSSSPPVAAK
jgi:transketolase